MSLKVDAVLLPPDLKFLSAMVKTMGKKDLAFILQYIMRRYTAEKGNMDLCAEARNIVSAINNGQLPTAKSARDKPLYVAYKIKQFAAEGVHLAI